MQSERWRSCTEIFHDALERAPNERAALLDKSCAGDTALRAQVELLLKYHDEAGEFIDSPAFAVRPNFWLMILTRSSVNPSATIGSTRSSASAAWA